MTIEEVIAHGREQLDVFGGEHAEFMKLSIEALEKQIPNEIIYDEYGRDEGYPHCPNCNETLINDFVGVRYCPKCGQALDWGIAIKQTIGYSEISDADILETME